MSDGIGDILVTFLMVVVFLLGLAIGDADGRKDARLDEAKRWCAQNPIGGRE